MNPGLCSTACGRKSPRWPRNTARASRVTEEAHSAEAKELKKEFEAKRTRLEVDRQGLQASLAKLERESSGELKQANESLAHEKKLHAATRERYERRVNELKTHHSLGIERVESDWMDKLEQLEKSLRANPKRPVSPPNRNGKESSNRCGGNTTK